METEDVQKKLEEAIGRLSDIKANLGQGPRHIQKYLRELDSDLTHSERILMDVRGWMNIQKAEAGVSEDSQAPVPNPGARKFGSV